MITESLLCLEDNGGMKEKVNFVVSNVFRFVVVVTHSYTHIFGNPNAMCFDPSSSLLHTHTHTHIFGNSNMILSRTGKLADVLAAKYDVVARFNVGFVVTFIVRRTHTHTHTHTGRKQRRTYGGHAERRQIRVSYLALWFDTGALEKYSGSRMCGDRTGNFRGG